MLATFIPSPKTSTFDIVLLSGLYVLYVATLFLFNVMFLDLIVVYLNIHTA